MKAIEKQTGRFRNPRQIRVYDFDDTICPEKVREIFSGRGRVGAVRIISGLKETVVCFALHEMRLDDDITDPVSWNGMKIYLEEGWDWDEWEGI